MSYTLKDLDEILLREKMMCEKAENQLSELSKLRKEQERVLSEAERVIAAQEMLLQKARERNAAREDAMKEVSESDWLVSVAIMLACVALARLSFL